jgi:hypothetical protein
MIFPLLATGVSLSIVIWLAQRKSMPAWLRGTGSIVAILAGVLAAYISARDTSYLGEESWYDASPWREIIFLLLMLIGMASRYFTHAIEQRREEVKRLKAEGQDASKVRLQFDVWEFSYPLFFAVVTFGGLLGQIQDGGVTLTHLVLSFQTGFFWQTLIKKPAGIPDAAG